ncbi:MULTISPECIES: hypothetical protein [unclassified Ensifer]|uniref:hypothetical protein n=1 Tax=unclassified Ensifer TaxID=2633371 RepID=UPI0008139F13|nr:MULTISPECIES: hypothetical protein [unclassified Ensifer]OCP05018.1 hypothetical protein BC362_14780 [Ensifer sp. LC14]OCP11823.1 hypothetical protein BC374_16225 [Ensifer sp. LC13]OCP12379.1 hypothetical protein BBX50_16420 [Ensifer sp. LC11]OCP33653.1 hypothetical protein BC364_15420 [Ensifer sp. LC499]
MHDPKDVTAFTIVPPPLRGRRESVRLMAHLRRLFPGYSFKLAAIAPVDAGDRFGIYPVMNFIGADNRSYVCNEPPNWLIGEIRSACHAFGDRRMAA